MQASAAEHSVNRTVDQGADWRPGGGGAMGDVEGLEEHSQITSEAEEPGLARGDDIGVNRTLVEAGIESTECQNRTQSSRHPPATTDEPSGSNSGSDLTSRKDSSLQDDGAKNVAFAKDHTAPPPKLSPQDLHYLNKAYVYLELQREWSALSRIGTLTPFGPPFLPHPNGPNTRPLLDTTKSSSIFSSLWGGGVVDQRNKEWESFEWKEEDVVDSPVLRYLFWRFIANAPALRDAKKEYWTDQIQPFFDSFAERGFSTTQERNEVTKRRLLAMGFTRLLGTYYSTCMTASGNPAPSRPSLRISKRIDGLVADDGARKEWEQAGERAEKLRTTWVAYKRALIDGDELNVTLDLVKTTPNMKDLPIFERDAEEWVRIWVAYAMHFLFVTSPAGEELLALLKEFHELIPYGAIKVGLMLVNPTLIFSVVVGSGVKSAKKAIVKLRHKLGQDTLADALKDHVYASILKKDQSRAASRNAREDIILIIIREQCSESEARMVTEWYQAWATGSSRLGDTSEGQKGNNAAAGRYQTLKELLQAYCLQRDKEQVLEITNEHNTPVLLRSSISVFYNAIHSIANVANLADRLGALQAFLDDLIKVATSKNNVHTEASDFIKLASRHDQQLYYFGHELVRGLKSLLHLKGAHVFSFVWQLSKGGNLADPMIGWASSALEFIKSGIPSSSSIPVPQRASVDYSAILEIASPETQGAILEEVRDLALVTKYKKAYADICLRADLLAVDGSLVKIDREELFAALMGQDAAITEYMDRRGAESRHFKKTGKEDVLRRIAKIRRYQRREEGAKANTEDEEASEVAMGTESEVDQLASDSDAGSSSVSDSPVVTHPSRSASIASTSRRVSRPPPTPVTTSTKKRKREVSPESSSSSSSSFSSSSQAEEPAPPAPKKPKATRTPYDNGDRKALVGMLVEHHHSKTTKKPMTKAKMFEILGKRFPVSYTRNFDGMERGTGSSDQFDSVQDHTASSWQSYYRDHIDDINLRVQKKLAREAAAPPTPSLQTQEKRNRKEEIRSAKASASKSQTPSKSRHASLDKSKSKPERAGPQPSDIRPQLSAKAKGKRPEVQSEQESPMTSDSGDLSSDSDSDSDVGTGKLHNVVKSVLETVAAKVTTATSATSSRNSPIAEVSKSPAFSNFTNEDDELLVRFAAVAATRGEGTEVIWKPLASEHNHHSAQEWERRWKENLPRFFVAMAKCIAAISKEKERLAEVELEQGKGVRKAEDTVKRGRADVQDEGTSMEQPVAEVEANSDLDANCGRRLDEPPKQPGRGRLGFGWLPQWIGGVWKS
ncbi:hypothetical protein P7C70_g3044, partial [Phenoliferia sp. Uapishka_3]